MYKKDLALNDLQWLIAIKPNQNKQDVTQGQFLCGVYTSLNSLFSFSKTGYHTEMKESSLPYYLPIAGGRIVAYLS